MNARDKTKVYIWRLDTGCEFEFEFIRVYVTCKDIIVIYVTAHMCRRIEEEVVIRSGSQRHRHFAGFFKVPVLHRHGTTLFIRLFWHTAPISRLLRHAGDTDVDQHYIGSVTGKTHQKKGIITLESNPSRGTALPAPHGKGNLCDKIKEITSIYCNVSFVGQYITSGPKGQTCTWVQCATFWRISQGGNFLFTDWPPPPKKKPQTW